MSVDNLSKQRQQLISLYKFLNKENLNQDDLSNFSISVYNLSEDELNVTISRYVQLVYHDFEQYIVNNVEKDRIKEETDIDKVCQNLQRLFRY